MSSLHSHLRTASCMCHPCRACLVQHPRPASHMLYSMTSRLQRPWLANTVVCVAAKNCPVCAQAWILVLYISEGQCLTASLQKVNTVSSSQPPVRPTHTTTTSSKKPVPLKHTHFAPFPTHRTTSRPHAHPRQMHIHIHTRTRTQHPYTHTHSAPEKPTCPSPPPYGPRLFTSSSSMICIARTWQTCTHIHTCSRTADKHERMWGARVSTTDRHQGTGLQSRSARDATHICSICL